MSQQSCMHAGMWQGLSLEGMRDNMVTDYMLKLLGLEGAADTVVGNAMLRGISGGQKKRVTTGARLMRQQLSHLCRTPVIGLCTSPSTTADVTYRSRQHQTLWHAQGR